MSFFSLLFGWTIVAITIFNDTAIFIFSLPIVLHLLLIMLLDMALKPGCLEKGKATVSGSLHWLFRAELWREISP